MTISKDDSVILDGAGDKKSIEERCEQVCSAFFYIFSSISHFVFKFNFDVLIVDCLCFLHLKYLSLTIHNRLGQQLS